MKMSKLNTNRKMNKVQKVEIDIYGDSLKTIKKTIENLIDQYGEDAFIDRAKGYSEGEYLAVFAYEPESDAEYKRWVARFSDYKDWLDKRDHDEFIRLQEKFSIKE
jgi:hypothetical protein